MSSLDLTIVAVYIVALFAVGISVGLRETADDFLILSRRANVFLVMFSVVSSWVGVGVIAGTAAAAYDSGISFALTGAIGAATAVAAAGFFAPRIKSFGDRYRAYTIGDFFGVRYSRGARAAAALTVAGVYMLFAAVQFNGLARLLTVWTTVDFRVAVIATAVGTIAYTAFAGIKSDFYTDAIHFVVMVLVLLGVLVPFMGAATHGFRDLRSLPASYFEPFTFGGPAYFFGGIVFGIGVVFVSMELWQRIYASTTQTTARRALIASAIGVVPFYGAAALAGLVLRAKGVPLADRDTALFVMMKTSLPRGVLGLGVAAFVGTFISASNTMMMVVSATLTKDFYCSVLAKQPPSDRDLLRIARTMTVAAGIGGVLLSFAVHDIVNLSVLALFLLLVLLPAVIGGFYWKRATATAAVSSILAGLVATFATAPKLGATAFVPGVIAASVTFVTVSFWTRHQSSEVVPSELGT